MAIMVVLVLFIAGGAIVQNKQTDERAWCKEHASECAHPVAGDGGQGVPR